MKALDMRSWQGLVTLIISVGLIDSCFLNSCPYRRYGRTLRCTSCGPLREGICLQDGHCCTQTNCFYSEACGSVSSCPDNFCRIDGVPGVCVAKQLCCTSGECRRNVQCLNVVIV
ncbi:hypothetical protein Q1695_001569 [Nippostrongylus brasiliensis]|nr:hypothetical protein Q1695_001569 [Nippostrongylus brasiliensis]